MKKRMIMLAAFSLLIVSCATTSTRMASPEQDSFPYPREKVFQKAQEAVKALGFTPSAVDEQKMEITIKLPHLSDYQRTQFMSCFESQSASSRYIIPEAKCTCVITVTGSAPGSQVTVTAEFTGRKVSSETGANLGWFRCKSTRQMEKRILRRMWKAFGGKRPTAK